MVAQQEESTKQSCPRLLKVKIAPIHDIQGTAAYMSIWQHCMSLYTAGHADCYLSKYLHLMSWASCQTRGQVCGVNDVLELRSFKAGHIQWSTLTT